MIKITKACRVAVMKAANSLLVRRREKHVIWKKTEVGENLNFQSAS